MFFFIKRRRKRAQRALLPPNSSTPSPKSALAPQNITSIAESPHNFIEPPSPLGIFARLPPELRHEIYGLAFSTIYWFRCSRPSSFFAHWATLPGSNWHREPTQFTFVLRVSKTFDRDVERWIHPFSPVMSGTRRKTMQVRIGVFGWSATHDPLQLGKGDVHALEINILAPDWQDEGQSFWLRRNTQEFMKHWNAAQIRGTWLRKVAIRFVNVNDRTQEWTVSCYGHRSYYHHYRTIDMILSVLQPQRGFQSPTIEMPALMGSLATKYRNLLKFKEWDMEPFQLYREIGKTELELDALLDRTPGPTAEALRRDRMEHFRTYEERALHLEFEWMEIARANHLGRVNPDWERRHEILDEMPWSQKDLLVVMTEPASSKMTVALAQRRRRIIKTMDPWDVLSVSERCERGILDALE